VATEPDDSMIKSPQGRGSSKPMANHMQQARMMHGHSNLSGVSGGVSVMSGSNLKSGH
jgi:hypothetical protein